MNARSFTMECRHRKMPTTTIVVPQVVMKCVRHTHTRRASLHGHCDCARRARVKTGRNTMYTLRRTLSARATVDFR